MHINGYKCVNEYRHKGKKSCGGLAVYVDNTIKAGVSKMLTSGTESIILKLKKDLFGLETDIYVFFAYCVPCNSHRVE